MALLFPAGAALAQVSASAALVSDYRFRGVSLSDGKAVPQLNLNYDGRHGWYAGLFASGVALQDGDGGQQLSMYAGYAARAPAGLSWEYGLAVTVFRPSATYNYGEAFLGLASANVGARLYYAPEYFGEPRGTLYGEINASYPLAQRWRLLAHGGSLHAIAGQAASALAPAARRDWRIGVSLERADWTWQLAWLYTRLAAPQTSPVYGYDSVRAPRTPRALLLSASYAF